MDILGIVLSILIVVLGTFYFFVIKKFYNFKKHGVPCIKTDPLLFTIKFMIYRQYSLADSVKLMYNTHPDARYLGVLSFPIIPLLIVRDPELIKYVGVKNFDHSPNHQGFGNEEVDPLFGNNLFSLRDDKWRDIRNLMSPAFTSSKMKGMFKLMSACAADFATFVSDLPSEKKTMDVKDALSRYTSDVIATCAFGIGIDSMRNPDNDFFVMSKVVAALNSSSAWKFILIAAFPKLVKLLNIKLFDDKVANFFKEIVSTTIKTRDEQGITRPDIIQLMMESRGKRGDKELTINEMVSQAFIFFFAGFDSTSTAMSFAAHELAVNPDIQKTLQDEVDKVLEETHGELTYEAVNGMEYLEAVIHETLRMYPVAVFTDRACKTPFELPPAVPGGKPFVVQEDVIFWFPTYALHRDPKYFENPDKFDPSRFLGENKKNLNNGAYMPFGIGPRMCIGNRFALLEIKVLLFHMLARCDLKPCAKTTIPMELSTKVFNMVPKDGFWLTIEPRSNPPSTIVNGKLTS